MSKVNAIVFSVRSSLLILLFGLSVLSTAAWADSDKPNESKETEGQEKDQEGVTFARVKNLGFGALMVAKGTDFSRFDEVQFFPTDQSKLEISSRSEPDSRRSWRRASDEELSVFGQSIDTMVEEVFSNRDTFDLVQQGGKGTLIIQVRLKEFSPMMVRAEDARDTVGTSQGLGNLGYLKLTAVLVDAEARQMVGVIEDAVLLDSQHVTHNTRSGQAIMIRRSVREWLTKLYEALESLKEHGTV